MLNKKVLILLLLTSLLLTQPVRGNNTIYIKADGSIEPPTAPIKRDANIYTLTDNISESIVVEKDDIIIDGASHIIQGQGEGIGIKLNNVRNVTIKSVVIKGFGYGIFLNSSSYCSIFGNSITNNPIGIGLLNSCNNSIFANNLVYNYFYGIYIGPASLYNNISRNTISRNYCGIYLSSTANNTILENNLQFNWFGIYIYVSSNNSIFHNNFINNTKQTMLHLSKNTWDNGYPSGGNFWSNYNGTDNYSGLNQNETGNDGIGDTPYLIDSNNTDKYPLIKPWGMGTPTANFTYSPAQPEAGKPITFNASNSKPMGGEIISYQWNFGDGNIMTTRKPVLTHTYLTPGTFNATLTIKDSEGLESQAWALIHVYGHNIAIKKVEPYRSWIYQGLPININVTIVNVGNFTEEATISLYYNITSNSKICQGKITLKPLEIKTITLTWNTTGVAYCHNYTITAIAEIEFDSNPSDNILQSSIKIHVRILGDVNGDNKVDMRDIGIAARAFGSYPGHERWNPDVDVNNDNKIDMRDIAISSRSFGKACR